MADRDADSMLAIMGKIDLQQSPDNTLVLRVNKKWFDWLRALVSGFFDSFHPNPPTSEEFAQTIVTAIEDHYTEERLQGERFNIERGLYIYSFSAMVCLIELRARYPFDEMDEVLLRMLDSDHIHIRTASGLALLAMGNKDVNLDLEGLGKSIELGAFFSFPLNYYFHILDSLLKREDLYKSAAKKIRPHFEKETYDFKEGSYVLFRFLETAIFLASTGELSKHSLMYLVYLSEGNVRDEIELAYVKRIRGVLIDLIENSPYARQVIADYMIDEGQEARGWEFIAFYKAWELVNWRMVDPQVVEDYLSLAGKMDSWGYDTARVIIKAILAWPNRIPQVSEWFRNYVDSLLNSDSDNDLNRESDSDDDLDWEPDLDDDSDEGEDNGSEFLSRLIGGLGELVKLNEIASSLLSLARGSRSIYLRYAALRSLLHYDLERQQLKSILADERGKTKKYLQQLYNSDYTLLRELGESEIMVTDEDVSLFMKEELQYKVENFDQFSL